MNVSSDKLHVYLLFTHIRSKHTKVRLRSWNFIFRSQFFIGNGRTQALLRASTCNACNLYDVNFLNHRFHTIGNYVQKYRYRLSTDMANISLIPTPIIGQSLLQIVLLVDNWVNASLKLISMQIYRWKNWSIRDLESPGHRYPRLEISSFSIVSWLYSFVPYCIPCTSLYEKKPNNLQRATKHVSKICKSDCDLIDITKYTHIGHIGDISNWSKGLWWQMIC